MLRKIPEDQWVISLLWISSTEKSWQALAAQTFIYDVSTNNSESCGCAESPGAAFAQ
jgi:hypothetical protein